MFEKREDALDEIREERYSGINRPHFFQDSKYDKFRNDQQVVLAAVETEPKSIEHTDLRHDRNFVLKATKFQFKETKWIYSKKMM